MANKLTSAQISKWYKRLNVARTQSGVGLSSVNESSYEKNKTSARITELVNNIKNTRTANVHLKNADDYLSVSNFAVGEKITQSDFNSIDNTIISLLRVCPNKTCETVCSNSGTNSNVTNTNASKSNGTNSNGKNSNGTCSNVAHSNGANSNGTCSNGTCSNGGNSIGWKGLNYTNGGCSNGHCWFGGNNQGTCSNGTCSNGSNSNVTRSNGANSNGANSNGTCSNVSHSNGTNSNGYKSNGNTNQIYDPATATYSTKNYYTEEQAIKRGDS